MKRQTKLVKIVGKEVPQRGENKYAILVSICFLLFYVVLQSVSIYGGDAGDLVSAAYVFGVAHPPGYPLYTFLGWLLTRLPIATVAWRVTLLSSLPAAATIGMLYLLLQKLIRSRSIALIAVMTFGFSYLFWLYASVPEVFSLHIFFITLCAYLFYEYHQTGKMWYLWRGVFVFGLALSHHHTIIFLLPAYFILVQDRLRKIPQKLALISKLFIAVCLGLLPYVYVVMAAQHNPPINWEDPKTLQGLIRLVTRAMYGTFRSGQTFGLNTSDRYLQLKLMLQTLVMDFTKAGLLLVAIGIYWQYRVNRKMFFTCLIGFLLIGPFFIFYSGFPIDGNFYLGMSERFLLAPYLFFVIWLSYGIVFISTYFDQQIRKVLSNRKFFFSTKTLFLVIPFTLLVSNLPKIVSLRNDQTAEKLGIDILNTVPPDSIIFLADDTSLFNAEYVYYTQGGAQGWQGKKLIQIGTLGYQFYTDVLKNEYPDSLGPLLKDNESFKPLITESYGKVPVFSNVGFDINADYVWVQTGLLKRLYKQDSPLNTEGFIKLNDEIFNKYQDPLAGALQHHTHLMLADAVRPYAISYFEVGKILLLTGKYVEAERYLRRSLNPQFDIPEARIKLAQALIFQNKCDEAIQVLIEETSLFPYVVDAYSLLAQTLSECKHDDVRAEIYRKIYNDKINEQKTDLSTEK